MEHEEDRENSGDGPSSTDRKKSGSDDNQEEHDLTGGEEEEEEEDRQVMNSPESMICGGPRAPERRHQCKECDKIFSSGKALGGHMSSAHVQASKDYSFKKLKSKITGSRAHLSSSEDNACPICGKLFHSQKSLYGHMRCHPDREWRGMEPPRLGMSQDQDFGDSLRGWPVKARRGRRPQPPPLAVSISDEYEDEEAVWAGHQLLSLLKPNLDGKENGYQATVGFGDHCYGPGSDNTVDCYAVKKEVGYGFEVNPEPRQETETETLAHESKRQKTNYRVKIKNTNCTINTNGKGKVKMDDTKGKGKTDFPPGPENPDHIESENNNLFFTAIGVLVNGMREDHPDLSFDFKKPVVENVLVRPDGLCYSSPDKYACSMCSKVFPTHQALGGHKSSHNKFKINIVNAVDQVTTSEDKNSNRKVRKNGEQKQAQLKCDDNNGGNIKDKGKVVWGFDLNMMPDDEDVEDSSGDKSEV
ncbi:C2H2 type zinc finger transcription factor family [Striga hermonthica]|uniref:C2H2 type zinc finger transcription factor family n=1 Tax=Striga hermonthica TaxID=68872 RepID=A0A9N7MU60_STRHE|nr:C2H2 type zinc finger transcription factor family [Striga hermonthica]